MCPPLRLNAVIAFKLVIEKAELTTWPPNSVGRWPTPAWILSLIAKHLEFHPRPARKKMLGRGLSAVVHSLALAKRIRALRTITYSKRLTRIATISATDRDTDRGPPALLRMQFATSGP